MWWKLDGPGLEEDPILPIGTPAGRLGSVAAGCPGEEEGGFGRHRAICGMAGVPGAAGGLAVAVVGMGMRRLGGGQGRRSQIMHGL